MTICIRSFFTGAAIFGLLAWVGIGFISMSWDVFAWDVFERFWLCWLALLGGSAGTVLGMDVRVGKR